MRKRAELKNTSKGQMVTCRLDGTFLAYDGPNGVGSHETLTILARETVTVDAAVLRQADVKRQIKAGRIRHVRTFVPLPIDQPALFDLTPRT